MNLLNFLKNNFLVFLFLTLTTLSFSQTTITSATNGNWSNTATWVGGVVPVAGDNVTIAAGHTVTLTAGVDITSGNLTLTGTIALAGFNLTAGSLAGAGNIGTSSGTPLVTVGSNGSSTTYSGVFSGTGARLTKEGSGTFTLLGANSYTGATVINAGTLQISGANNRIPTASALTISTGATFDMNGRSQSVFLFAGGGTITSSVAGAVTITHGGGNSSSTFSGVIQNGSGTVALSKPLTGTITLTGTNTYTGGTSITNGGVSIGNGGTSGSVAGNITFGSTGTVFFNRSDDFTFSGNISGSGTTVFKQGAGTMTLTGSITSIGSVAVQGGTLSIGNGGTSGSVSVNINNTATVVFNRSDNITYSNVISNSGTITKLGAGTLTLTGNNTNSGAFNVNVGTVQISTASERIGNNCSLNVASGATFNLNGFSETIASIAGAGTITSTVAGAVTLTNGGTNTTTFSGVIQNGSGTVSLTKSGTGILTLSGANTYSGGTTLSAGTLNINNASAIGTGTFTISGVATINNTTVGAITLSTNNAQSWNANFTFTGTQPLDMGTGAVTLSATRTVTVTASTLTVGGVISGTSFGLTKAGVGTLTLTGTNTYTGVTTISAGTLKLGANERISNSSALSVGSGAFLDLNGFSETVASITGGGTVTSSVAGDVTFTYAGDANSTFTGVIQDGSGKVALVKQGIGFLNLGGANTYTGGTTVSAGSFQIGNSGSGSIVGDIVNNGNVTFNRSVAWTFPGIISGTGTVLKTGPSSLVLSGANTYTGKTTLVSGTTVITSDNNLGTPPATATPGHLEYSGTANLQTSATFTLNANRGILLGGVTGTKRFTVDAGTTLTYGGVITAINSDFFTKQGDGTLELTGASTYTGVTTTVSLGTLSLGNGGTTGSLSVDIVNNASVIINRSDDHTFSRVISGSGSLTKKGAGTVTFSSAQTYTGATTVEVGTLRLGAAETLSNSSALTVNTGANFDMNGFSETVASIAGAGTISSNAAGSVTLTNGGTNTTTFSGVIQNGNGTVALTKSGTGILILSGANTLTGTISVTAGTLVGNNPNALSSCASVTVNSNSILRSDVASVLPPLTLNGTGSTAGKMNCNGFNSTTNQLTLGTTSQPDGTYGSTSSSATIQNNTYFTAGATGIITVGAPCTVSAASSIPTLCDQTALSPITHTTTGAIGIGTSSGLPSGVSASWSANTITISGTPTIAGVFNYSIPLSVNCGSVNATGTITVNPVSVGGTVAGSTAVCTGTNSTLLTLSGNTGAVTKWQSATSSDFSIGLTDISNTTTSLTATDLTATTYYRAVIGSGVCSTANSSTGTITVDVASVGGTVAGSTELCPGTNSTTLTLAGNTGAVTKWQSATASDFSTGLTDISNTTTSLIATNLTVTTYYRAVIGSGVCATANSTTGTIIVYTNCYDWISTSSTNWNVPSNWGQNEVPSENARIKIAPSATANLSLDQDRKIESLNLNQRGIKVVLGNNNLTINGAIVGENLTSYIRTNLNGSISTTLNNGATKKFPVGQADYNPVTITNYNTTADSISVRVKDSVLLEAYSGTLVNTVNVQRTWFIKKNNPNTLGVDFVYEWDTTNQLGFMPGYYLNHFEGSNWEIADFDNYGQIVKNGSRVSLSLFGYQGGFSPFTFGDSPSSPLPVELLDFTATCLEDNTVSIDWSTASEQNSDYFQVMKSLDGFDWQILETVKAAGNSTSLLNYLVLDRELQSTNSYYRLKQFDIDGQNETYEIVAVDCKEDDSRNELISFPNPSENNFYVNFKSKDVKGVGKLTVFDSKGLLIFSKSVQISEGSNVHAFEDFNVPVGIYFVSLQTDNYKSNVVKQVVK